MYILRDFFYVNLLQVVFFQKCLLSLIYFPVSFSMELIKRTLYLIATWIGLAKCKRIGYPRSNNCAFSHVFIKTIERYFSVEIYSSWSPYYGYETHWPLQKCTWRTLFEFIISHDYQWIIVSKCNWFMYLTNREAYRRCSINCQIINATRHDNSPYEENNPSSHISKPSMPCTSLREIIPHIRLLVHKRLCLLNDNRYASRHFRILAYLSSHRR